MNHIDDYDEVKDCMYKGNLYSVRDNGAILRHQRIGKNRRKLDEVWTFGTRNVVTGYMEFCGERVHRIVATAFHGEASGAEYVVDHIDTNRQNNRPENLRWLTRLENVLSNEITRKKVELICGSIEAFLENPQLLYGHEMVDKHFSWMKNVTKAEAEKCLANWKHWAKTATPSHDYMKSEHHVGDWIFQKSPIPASEQTSGEKPFQLANDAGTCPHDSRYPRSSYNAKECGDIDWSYLDALRSDNIDEEYDKVKPQVLKGENICSSYANEIGEKEPVKVQSLTPNAVQIDWKNPVEFPCCPQRYADNPLKAYMSNLKEDKVFATSKMGDSTIIRYGMIQPECLLVMCHVQIGFKAHAITKITFAENIFYHENMGVYDIGDDPEFIFDDMLSGK